MPTVHYSNLGSINLPCVLKGSLCRRDKIHFKRLDQQQHFWMGPDMLLLSRRKICGGYIVGPRVHTARTTAVHAPRLCTENNFLRSREEAKIYNWDWKSVEPL